MIFFRKLTSCTSNVCLEAVGDLRLNDGLGDLVTGLDHVLYDDDSSENYFVIRIGDDVQQALIPLYALKIEDERLTFDCLDFTIK